MNALTQTLCLLIAMSANYISRENTDKNKRNTLSDNVFQAVYDQCVAAGQMFSLETLG